jgi:hypothetical protein
MGTLVYQPCGALACPVGAFCDGDEDVTVWLCSGRECIGYGFFESPIEMGFNAPDEASAGIYADYEGAIGRLAAVSWLCDSAGAPGMLRLPENVSVMNRILRFDVWAVDACVKVAPTEHR